MLEKQNSRESDGRADHRRRLEDIIRTKRVLRFHEDIPDKEFPFVTCSIYGAPRTNELFVKLSNGRDVFVEAIQSKLIVPPMEDRIFGMDILDQDVAFQLADQMREKHRATLLRRGGER